MSFRHVNLIYSLPVPNLSPAQSYVLNRLAARADDATHLCHPGAALLARETGYTLRGVRKVLRELEQAGIVTKHKGTLDTHWRSQYEMTFTLAHLAVVEEKAKEEFTVPAGTGEIQGTIYERNRPPRRELRPPRPGVYENALDRRPDESALAYAARVDRNSSSRR